MNDRHGAGALMMARLDPVVNEAVTALAKLKLRRGLSASDIAIVASVATVCIIEALPLAGERARVRAGAIDALIHGAVFTAERIAAAEAEGVAHG